MVFQDKSIDQLKEMRENLKIHLHKLEPQADPETSVKSIVKARELMLSNGPDEDKRIALVGFIRELDEKIFRTYSRLIDNSKENVDLDKAVYYMNEYVENLLVPYSEGIDLQQWKRDYRDWKLGNKGEELKRELSFQIEMLHLKFVGYLLGR
jgi:hypothetical protein